MNTLEHLYARKSTASRLVVLLALLAVSLLPAQSRAAGRPGPAEDWAALVAAEGTLARVLTAQAVPEAFAGTDFATMTKREWKALRKQQVKALGSSDARVREEALKNVIYLATNFRDQINFKDAGGHLTEIYALDGTEAYRMMAVAAMHAIGHENTMANLAQRVRLEGSPRVRRLAIAAVVDYYSQGQVKVGRPVRVEARGDVAYLYR